MENDKSPLNKRLWSFRYAFRGIGKLFQSEVNARIHLAATLVVITAGLYFKLSLSEWLWIILAITLVFILEMVNTAIEELCDLIDDQFNKRIEKIKDISAGAVLFGALFAICVACAIFLPRMITCLE